MDPFRYYYFVVDNGVEPRLQMIAAEYEGAATNAMENLTAEKFELLDSSWRKTSGARQNKLLTKWKKKNDR